MSGKLRVLLISLGQPELVQGGSPIVCQELFDELRARDSVECHMLAAVDRESGDMHQPKACITGFDNRDGMYLLHQTDFDPWLQRNQEPRLVESFAALLSGLVPDVVHFHHFQTIGADLISAARVALPSCRIVFTFHEFAAICAADGHMVRRTDRSLCDRASPLRCHQCLPNRSPDAFLSREMWLKQNLRHVDHFTTPSAFMIAPYVTWGLPAEKISHVPNGQRSRVIRKIPPPATGLKTRFGYFGQLHDDKGIGVLLRAADLLRDEGFSDFHLDINGGGIQHASAALRSEIEAFQAAEAERAPAARLVSFNGSYTLDQIQSRMARVDWTIVPSIWWEIFGLVISEAWMFGRPVICSNVGGMAERVTDGVDGLHFEMGDPAALAMIIRRAATEDGLWERLHAAVPAPPSRTAMGDAFLSLYAPV